MILELDFCLKEWERRQPNCSEVRTQVAAGIAAIARIEPRRARTLAKSPVAAERSEVDSRPDSSARRFRLRQWFGKSAEIAN